MAVFRFTVTGTIEADAEALGAAMAASLPLHGRRRAGIMESSLEFSENPGSALQALLEMGVMAVLQPNWAP
ncbi:hypothetical protein [Arthrobacter sp. Leaf337]|uniref:hypothetical protein n=1 Tax=Arthrobacter sp. Leaf337 TaxID=1736342 RepID=UPI000B2E5A27|nr:hypothetical protein [Arthrobacter sp. Leaf337]